MSVCTMNRFAAIQDCPLFCTRALTAVLTASSRSTEGITMNGSLPPSSITVGLISSPQMVATDWSVGLSVRQRCRRDPGIAQDPLYDLGRHQQRLETASGKPPRVITSERYSADCGTLEARLIRPM